MSGREESGWGDCVWCGEMLKPEDKDPYSDLCEFCEKWDEVALLLIKREYYAKKKVREILKRSDDFYLELHQLIYWKNREDQYEEIHRIMIEAVNVKKCNLWGECY